LYKIYCVVIVGNIWISKPLCCTFNSWNILHCLLCYNHNLEKPYRWWSKFCSSDFL